MKKLIDILNRSDQLVLLSIFTSVIATALILGTYFVLYNYLPPRLPLFYSISWGENQLVTKQQFLILPAVLVLITLVNIFISSHLHPLQIVLKKIISFQSIFIALAILITAIKILFIFV